jgi:spermidine synthase
VLSETSPTPRPARPRALYPVSALFFLSGAAGLVYQVLWMRSLGLFFGSDMFGVSIILSTFMGGLALGSAVGGRIAERLDRPLLGYGLAELGIGVVALPFASVLASLDPLLHAAYGDASGAERWVYQGVRVLLAGGALLVPTTLMGSTLPLILRHFVRTSAALGESAAHFYAINTLGALCGTLAAGFVLLPYLGMSLATACAAGTNLAIGALCIAFGFRARVPREPEREALRRASEDLDPLPGIDAGMRRRMASVVVLAFGVSGFGSFALEVLWTRILLITFSATVYSFTATLVCFLFGIFMGSRLVARQVDRSPNPIALFARLELGIGASVAILALLLHALPSVFGRLLSLASGAFPGQYALVIATLLASFPLLMVPATLLGATFPVALRVYTTNVARIGSRTGNLYAANTLGAVLGSLSAGLILIPSLGAMASLVGVALLFLAVGAVLARSAVRSGLPTPAGRTLPVLAGVGVACGLIALGLPYRVTLNFNQARLDGAELLYHAEGIQNTIDVVRSPSGATSLVIGGNVEADDGERQRRHFVLKGHLPLLLHDDPSSVLVVGLGMGITLQATARHPGIERIDVIELSPEILAAQEHLAAVNGDVLNDPRVHVRIDDGRLFMKLSRERYDMITADPIHPKISRVGYLYTREYYRSIRERLGDGGVVCQWMPVYQIAPRRLRSAIGTFFDVFPTATLWYVEGHLLLVARPDGARIDFPLLAERLTDPNVRSDMASIDIHSAEDLLSHLLMGPDGIRAYLAADGDVPLNTDDYPYLEYFVPGDLFSDTERNVRDLVPHLRDPALAVRELPPAAARRLATLSADREQRLLTRRGEPGRE